ncbi:MAG TPA: SRPBCC family protein [Acidimicrobiales bacterium]|nr:SRPBCC family protein [Acidimicrobiales bacterium]
MHGDTVSVERTIPASAEAIFAVLADPGRHHEIDGSGTVTGPPATAARLRRVGDSFTMPMRMGLPYRMVNTVVELEEGRRIAWQPRLAVPLLGGVVGGRVWRYELEPVAGGTLVRETWDLSRDPLRALIKRSPLGSETGPNMEKTLERLEAAVVG